VKLSGLDSAFLALESETWQMHVVCLTIVDASATGGRIDHDAFKQTFTKRLHRLPLLARRLVEHPLGLVRPHWVDDPEFDLDNHMHRATVAAPGGREQLSELAVEIYSNRLPRHRPLWEWWVVDGLADGRVAHLWKVHHTYIDGRAGAAMQEIFFDRDIAGTLPAGPPVDVAGEDTEPAEGLAGLLETVKSVGGTPLRLGRSIATTVQGGVQAAATGRLGQALPLVGMPRTRFNAPIGKERSYGFCTVNLSDVKYVKNTFGVKINDVYLAIVGGAIRDQLARYGEEPENSLVTVVPMDASRGGAHRGSGNMITGMLVDMATDVDDVAERLLCVHENATASKTVQGKLGNDLLENLADAPPPALLSLGGKLIRGTKVMNVLPPVTNAITSNVPGPRATLYSQGQKVEAFHSMGIIGDGFGLFIGGMSYDDQIDIGILADKHMLPDPFALADSIVDQLNMLLKAAHEFTPSPETGSAVIPDPAPETAVDEPSTELKAVTEEKPVRAAKAKTPRKPAARKKPVEKPTPAEVMPQRVEEAAVVAPEPAVKLPAPRRSAPGTTKKHPAPVGVS
jgi:WS/DGAT/MGAT family acyltransferase